MIPDLKLVLSFFNYGLWDTYPTMEYLAMILWNGADNGNRGTRQLICEMRGISEAEV